MKKYTLLLPLLSSSAVVCAVVSETLLPNTHVGKRARKGWAVSRLVVSESRWRLPSPVVSGKSPHLLFLQDYRAVTVAVLIVFLIAKSAENESGFGAFKFRFFCFFALRHVSSAPVFSAALSEQYLNSYLELVLLLLHNLVLHLLYQVVKEPQSEELGADRRLQREKSWIVKRKNISHTHTHAHCGS